MNQEPISGSWDLAAILLIAIAVSIVIKIVDKVWLAPQRRAMLTGVSDKCIELTEEDAEKAQRIPVLVDLANSILPVLIIVLLLRSFMVEPFRIPSGSMTPTLWEGDFILVNKFVYGLRLPVLNTKVIDISEPQRGDVMVFRYPQNPSLPFIKRIVGVPGDHLSYDPQEKILYLNEEPVSLEQIGIFSGEGSSDQYRGNTQYVEYLPGAEHQIIKNPMRFSQPKFNDLIVPEGHYFVLGDNRDDSKDSRFWGFVPESHVMGEAFMIWMHWDNWTIRWNRIGNWIE